MGEFADRIRSIRQETARQESIEDQRIAAANLEDSSAFTRGLQRGAHGLLGTVHGLRGAIGSMTGDKVARDEAFRQYQEQQRIAQRFPKETTLFGDEGTESALQSPGTFIAESLGEAVPSLAEFLVTGAVGAAIGSQVTPGIDPSDLAAAPAGFIAGVLGRGAIKRKLADMGLRYATKQLIKEGGEELLQQSLQRMTRAGLANWGAKQLGSRLGSFAALTAIAGGQEGGANWADLYEKGIDAPGSSLAMGVLSGASESLIGATPGMMKVFQRPSIAGVLKRVTQTRGVGQAAGVLWDMAKQGGEEGLQEGVQELLSMINMDLNDPDHKWTKESFKQFVESAAAGGVVGLTTGGIGGARQVAGQALAGRGPQVQEDEISDEDADAIMDEMDPPEKRAANSRLMDRSRANFMRFASNNPLVVEDPAFQRANSDLLKQIEETIGNQDREGFNAAFADLKQRALTWETLPSTVRKDPGFTRETRTDTSPDGVAEALRVIMRNDEAEANELYAGWTRNPQIVGPRILARADELSGVQPAEFGGDVETTEPAGLIQEQTGFPQFDPEALTEPQEEVDLGPILDRLLADRAAATGETVRAGGRIIAGPGQVEEAAPPPAAEEVAPEVAPEAAPAEQRPPLPTIEDYQALLNEEIEQGNIEQTGRTTFRALTSRGKTILDATRQQILRDMRIAKGETPVAPQVQEQPATAPMPEAAPGEVAPTLTPSPVTEAGAETAPTADPERFILNKSGMPYKARAAAQRAARQAGIDAEKVVPVEGGFAIEKDATQDVAPATEDVARTPQVKRGDTAVTVDDITSDAEKLSNIPLRRRLRRAAPILDLDKQETGWRGFTTNDGSIITDGDKVLEFRASDPRSGTATQAARAQAESHAIDNRIEQEKESVDKVDKAAESVTGPGIQHTPDASKTATTAAEVAEARQNLLGQIDESLAEMVSELSEQPGSGDVVSLVAEIGKLKNGQIVAGKNKLLELANGYRIDKTLEFNVPNDGNFKVDGNLYSLLRFKAKVEMQFRRVGDAGKPTTGRLPGKEAKIEEPLDREAVAAVLKDPKNTTEKKLREQLENQGFIRKFGQDFALTDKGETLLKSLEVTDKPKPKAPKAEALKAKVKARQLGSQLSKEERKKVLQTLRDVYIENNVPKIEKGVDARGEDIIGYPFAPEFFVTSDITGKKLRYYITMPDGKIAHPTEVGFSEKQVNRQIAENEFQARVQQERDAEAAQRVSDSRTPASEGLGAMRGKMSASKAFFPGNEYDFYYNKETDEIATASVVDADYMSRNGWQKWGDDGVKLSDLRGEAPGVEKQPAKPKQKAAPAKERIEDFGEKLGGARKDYAGILQDAESLDIGTEQLSKTFPEPKYQELIASGADPVVVGTARAIRDQIGAKPRSRYKVDRWIDEVKTVRETFKKLISGEMSIDDISPLDLSPDRRNWSYYSAQSDRAKSRGELYAAVGHDRSLKGISMAEEFFEFMRTRKPDGTTEDRRNVKMWRVRKSRGNRLYSIIDADTKEDAIKQFKEWLSKQGGKKREVKFSIYRDRLTDDIYIGKKVGRNIIRAKEGFESAQDAREFLKDRYSEVLEGYEKAREILPERRSVNNPRVGETYRTGDVSPETFQDAFGFRGVEFGNWVEGDRRQQDLNETFDALHDMAAILGIPTRAVSLNGRLGLGFGSRGHGGARAPKAHFEPGKMVINLTKRAGAGSLAHEWLHAMDNHFGSQDLGIEGGSMLTESRNRLASEMRPELFDAFRGIKEAIDKTDLKKRSRKIDAKRTKPYWATDVEMYARAFESFIIDELDKGGFSNDFLANIVDEETFGNPGEYPYLTKAEKPGVAKAFKKFFSEVKTKETPTGIQLYSIAEGVTPGDRLTVEQIQDLVDDFGMGESVTVIQSIDDLPANQRAALSEKAEEREYIPDTISGVASTGEQKAYVIADNLEPGRAMKVILHEAVGHIGTRRAFGEEKFGELLDSMMQDPDMRKDIKALADTLKIDMAENPLEAAEEFLARIAENNDLNPSLWQRIVARVRTWLRNVGLVGKWSENDIRALLAKSAVAARAPGRPQQVNGDIRFSVSRQKVDKIKDRYEKQIKAIQEAKELKEVIDLARKVIRQENIPKLRRSQMFTQLRRIADAKRPGTKERRKKMAIDLIKHIQYEAQRMTALQEFRKIREGSDAQLKKMYPEGKMTPEVQRIRDKIVDVAYMESDAFEKRLDFLSGLQERDDGILNDNQQEELSLMHTFGNITDRSLEEIEEALDRFGDIVKFGKMTKRIAEKERRERMSNLRESTIEQVTEGADIEELEKKRKLDVTKTGLRKFMQKAGELGRDFDFRHLNFEYILARLSGDNLDSNLSKWGRDLAHESTRVEEAGLLEQETELHDKAAEVFGVDGRKLAKELNSMAQPTENTGVYRYNTETGKQENQLVLSQNEAMDLYMKFQDPSLFGWLNDQGLTVETKAQVEDFLTAQQKEMADWLLEEFYPKYYQGINEVYKKRYNIDLPFNPAYSPLSVEHFGKDGASDLLADGPTFHSSVRNGSLKSRTQHSRKYKPQGALDAVYQHVQQMEHFKAWAESDRELRSVLMSEPVQKAIRLKYGNTAAAVLNRTLDRFAAGGTDGANAYNLVDKWRANFTKAVIAANPVVMFKQLTSIPAYAADMPTADFAAGVADFFTKPAKAINFLNANSRMMQSRYKKGWDRDVKLALKANLGNQFAGVKSLIDMMSIFTKIGDKAAIVVGGWAAYQYHYKKAIEAGMSEADAKKEGIKQFEILTERSQQAGGQKDLSDLQTQSSFTKLFTMFATSPLSYYRSVMLGVRNIAKGRGTAQDYKRVVIGQVILPALFQFVANGMKWDDDDDPENNLFGVFPQRMARAMALGPFNKLFLIGNAMDALGESATGGNPFAGSESSVPILTPFSDLTKAAKRMNKMVTEDDEITMGDVFQVMDDIASGSSKLAGIPYDPVSRAATGAKEAITGQTRYPFRRSVGYSRYALGESRKGSGGDSALKQKKAIYDRMRQHVTEGGDRDAWDQIMQDVKAYNDAIPHGAKIPKIGKTSIKRVMSEARRKKGRTE